MTNRQSPPPAGPPRVLVVTRLPLRCSEPCGWKHRLCAFVRELATAADVELLVIESQRGQVSGPIADDDLPLVGAHLEPCREASVRDPGWAGRARRLHRIFLSSDPTRFTPHRSHSLAGLLATGDFDLVVLHLPITGQLGRSIPPGVPLIWLFDEWVSASAPLLRPEWPAAVHRAAAHRESTRLHRLLSAVGGRADAVVVIAAHEGERLAPFMPDTAPVVIGHGIDGSAWNGTGAAGGDIDVAVFGRLETDRNLVGALAVHDEAARSHPGWRWAFVGRAGPGLADRVPEAMVTGAVEDLRPFYERARVVLVPASEGNGVKTTLLQAWAMRRPTVATTRAVRGSAAVDGINVLVADSPPQLVAHIDRVLASPEVGRQLAAAGRTAIEEHHQIDRAADRFRELCMEVVSRSSARARGVAAGT